MNANKTSAPKSTSFAGRAQRIAALCGMKGFNMNRIIKTIKAEFPGSSLCKIKSGVAANR